MGSCDGYRGDICGCGGVYWCCMVPSEGSEVGALGGMWLVGRLGDLDVDVAEVGWHVEVVAAGDRG